MLLLKEGVDQWMKEDANKKERVVQIQFNSWQFENYEDTKLTLIETVLTAIEKDLKKQENVLEKTGDFLKKIKYLKLGVFFIKKIAQQILPEELMELFPTKEEWENDGSWIGIVEIPGGLQDKFYTELSGLTHGEVETKLL
jgi:predicted KAP-like P-loop ATPase